MHVTINRWCDRLLGSWIINEVLKEAIVSQWLIEEDYLNQQSPVSNVVADCISFSQYEELNSMGMLLTDTQRKWVNFLKEAARKKPPSRQMRPQVSNSNTRSKFNEVIQGGMVRSHFQSCVELSIRH